MKTDLTHLFLVLAITSIIFISGCIDQWPFMGGGNVSVVGPNVTVITNVTNVSVGMPNVTVTTVGKPYDDRGLAMLNLTIRIEGTMPKYLHHYSVWLIDPEGQFGPSRHDLWPEDMADGVEDIAIELEDSYITPTPGTYKVAVYETTYPPSGWPEEREIYRKSIGTFSGADLKVLEGTYLEYEQISFPCCAYSVNSVNMTFRNDGDLPAYPYLIVDIDGASGYAGAFTAGERSGSLLWARGVGPGETVNGYFGLGDWRGKHGEGFSSGSHSVRYTIYQSVYHPDLGGYVNENITTFTGTVSFSKR